MEKNQERLVRFYIRKLGLPEQETLKTIQGMDEIEQAKAISDLMTKSTALDLGLSENATDEEINKKLSEKTRETAINLGLPENTTSKELYEYQLEQERLKIVKELCLPENATWEDIVKYKPKKIEYSSDELNQQTGKAFVQTMSQPLENYRNNLQSSRNERYNNTIEEYENKERIEQINKLKKELSRLDYNRILDLIDYLLLAPEFDDNIYRFENKMHIGLNWENFMMQFKKLINIENYKSLLKIDIIEAIKDVYNNYEEYSKSNDVRMGK